jgi:MauM/NapG family ferredoxin protein
MSNVRRAVQVAVFAVFLFLLIRTVSPVESPLKPDIFMRLDPLAAASTALSSWSASIILTRFQAAIVVVLLTLVLGRFFCNWVCPLGTTLDIWERLTRGRSKHVGRPRVRRTVGLRNLKYYILAVFLIAAVFSTQVAYILDPIPLATRSYALAIYPYFTYIAKAVLSPLWEVPVVNRISEPLYGFLKAHVFYPNPDIGYQPITWLHHLVFAFFAGVLALSLLQPRFWCRYLCPLGAMLGLMSRTSVLRWTVDREKCTHCNRCARECKTGAIAENAEGYRVEECVECFNCESLCGDGAIKFRFASPLRSIRREREAMPGGLGLTRRRFVQSAAVAAVTVPFLKLRTTGRDPNPWLIRPPGSLAEEDFLDRCIRCGECMKVCPTSGLHPTLFEADLEGIGTPKLVPSIGYCDYECNSCGRVCPTGAIANLTLEEKKETKIGTAYFVKDKCYPWNENINCLVCEEHCPTPEKSIKFWDVEVLEQETNRIITVKRPYVVTETCIGCGICENKCPLKDEPGIRVTAREEDRHPGRYSGGKPVRTGPAGLLPEPGAVAGVVAMGEISEYRDETLYDFLNGGAELYFDYGIAAVASVEYTTGEGEPVEVSVYDMGSPEGAFGIYSNMRYPGADFVAVGNEGMLSASSLDFYKGRYYCRIVAFGTGPGTEAAVMALGRALASGIPEAGSPPALLDVLPRGHRVERSEKYFSRPIALNNIHYVGPENVFGLGPGTRGVTALYKMGGAEFTVFVMEYPGEEEAQKGLASYRAYLGDAAGAPVEARGRFVAGVWDLGGEPAQDFLRDVLAGLEANR